MMATSMSIGVRCRGYEGTRDFGNWSTQGDRPYLVIRAAL
jgi:hypothetical protein